MFTVENISVCPYMYDISDIKYSIRDVLISGTRPDILLYQLLNSISSRPDIRSPAYHQDIKKILLQFGMKMKTIIIALNHKNKCIVFSLWYVFFQQKIISFSSYLEVLNIIWGYFWQFFCSRVMKRGNIHPDSAVQWYSHPRL